jgi:glycosyltransferase involved in cell wall biosynthesis
MNNYPLVSIITPTYNHEKFIGQCIESVLAQTYPHWEQIIIDDGSKDKTREIIERYKDNRIRFFRQENKGIFRLSETYNKALEIAQGELIAMLEGDDFWPSWKLERQIPAFERQETVLSWGKAAVTNSDGKTINYMPEGIKWFDDVPKKDLTRKLLFRNFIPACTVICRKDALVSIKGFRQLQHSPTVDYPTWLELSLIGKFDPIDEVLGFWRRHASQASAIWIKEMTETHNQSAIAFFESLPEAVRGSLDISANDLAKGCQSNIANMNFALGRTKLNKGKWNEARENLRQAWREGTFSLKVKALLGITCSYFDLDLEWAAVLMGRHRLSEFT